MPQLVALCLPPSTPSQSRDEGPGVSLKKAPRQGQRSGGLRCAPAEAVLILHQGSRSKAQKIDPHSVKDPRVAPYS
jgi:hypothetical protein